VLLAAAAVASAAIGAFEFTAARMTRYTAQALGWLPARARR
jgi:hypothetical protein